MVINYTTTLPEGDGEFEVNVSADMSFDRGQEGTLSDAGGWEVDIFKVVRVDSGDIIEINNEQREILTTAALDHE